jgi:hypothetical protein
LTLFKIERFETGSRLKDLVKGRSFQERKS